ncbi:MAG TPA: methyltransferase domain-containing protein [Gemmatimonadales bacterium]
MHSFPCPKGEALQLFLHDPILTFSLTTPRRRRGVERLDEPGVDPRVRLRSLADVARSNRVFGGLRAMLGEVERALPELGPRGTLLDVGTGLGDVPEAVSRLAARRGVELRTVGIDTAPELAAAAAARTTHALCGDAFRLPFADSVFDVVTCSQLLHHFPEREGLILLRELHRVARLRVVVGDLRRSWAAAAGFWLASWPLGFHPVTRHDGTLSVLRGFTAHELRRMVRSATGVEPTVRRRAGWRLTASWCPATSTPTGPA